MQKRKAFESLVHAESTHVFTGKIIGDFSNLDRVRRNTRILWNWFFKYILGDKNPITNFQKGYD